MFAVWLYAGKLLLPEDALDGISSGTTGEIGERLQWKDIDLAKMYAFAWLYSVRALRNDIMTTLIHKHERRSTLVGETAICLVFDCCGSGCTFSHFIIHQYADSGLNGHDLVPNNIETWPRSSVVCTAPRLRPLKYDYEAKSLLL